MWIRSAAQLTTVQVAELNHFAQKVMLCGWWNFEGITNHFELVQNGAMNAAALYSEQLDHVYASLAARYPAALISRKPAAFFIVKIKEMSLEIEFLRNPACRPDSAPSDYDLPLSMVHLLRSDRTFDSLAVVENWCHQEFLPPNRLSGIGVVEFNNCHKSG